MIHSAPAWTRRLAATQTLFTLLLAFALAPFEHVHPAGANSDGSAIVHVHFFEMHAPHPAHDGRGLDDLDDDHGSAWQLDIFNPVVPTAWAPSAPSRGPVIPVTLTETTDPVITVEERGHDPPLRDLFPPRSPPVRFFPEPTPSVS